MNLKLYIAVTEVAVVDVEVNKGKFENNMKDDKKNGHKKHDKKEKDSKKHDKKEKDPKDHDKKEKDHKDHDKKKGDDKEHDQKEKEHKKHDEKEKDHKDHDKKEKDHKDHDKKKGGHKEHDKKEKDHKEHDSNDVSVKVLRTTSELARYIVDTPDNICASATGEEEADLSDSMSSIQDAVTLLKITLEDIKIQLDGTLRFCAVVAKTY